MRIATVIPLVLVLALVNGCSSGPDRTTATTATTPPTPTFGPDGRASCRPPSPTARWHGNVEYRGTIRSTTGSAYGFSEVADDAAVHAGPTSKFVWRITGRGDLTVTATGPDGAAGRIDWGPEEHSGSNDERPGREWGVGIAFPASGCWHVRLSNRQTRADVWLTVSGS